MPDFRRSAALAVLAVSLVAGTAVAQSPAPEDEADPTFLYVASSAAASIDGGVLTLDGVPAVIYFSDRPDRVAGHEPASDFVRNWEPGPDSFGEDPPNAVLSVLGTEEVEDVVLELVGAQAADGDLTFGFVLLDGELPDGELGPASLFVDIFNNWTPCTECAG